MGPIGFPEMLVWNHHSALRKIKKGADPNLWNFTNHHHVFGELKVKISLIGNLKKVARK